MALARAQSQTGGGGMYLARECDDKTRRGSFHLEKFVRGKFQEVLSDRIYQLYFHVNSPEEFALSSGPTAFDNFSRGEGVAWHHNGRARDGGRGQQQGHTIKTCCVGVNGW